VRYIKTILLLTLLFPLYGKGYVSNHKLEQIRYKLLTRSGLPNTAVNKAINFYKKNRYKKHLSKKFLAIIDYTQPAYKKRLYIIDLYKNKYNRYQVAHGMRSGPINGRVTRPSNVIGSSKTPIGFFKLGHKTRTTIKKRYKYLAVVGLENRNRNAKKRQILFHTAKYVARGGRSHGCFAIRPQDKKKVFWKMKGTLLYSYALRK